MSVIDQCRDAYGCLSDANREVLEQALERTDEDIWARARRVVISATPMITLGMAVRSVSRQPPEAVPDPFTVYRALRYAVERRQEFIKRFSETDIEGWP